jgi:hypothetical protein
MYVIVRPKHWKGAGRRIIEMTDAFRWPSTNLVESEVLMNSCDVD